jgi:hypothetical protein
LFIGQNVYVKHENKVQIGKVEVVYEEDLDIRLPDGVLIQKKWWEIKKVEIKNEE